MDSADHSAPPERGWAADEGRDERVPSLHHDDLAGPPTGSPSPEQLLSDAWESVRGLTRGDKLTLGGILATLVLAFTPWKETAAEGEIPGVLSQGLVVVGANALALGALIVRVRGLPRMQPVIPWMLQLGALAFGLLWCFIFMKVSSDGRLVPTEFGLEPRPVSASAFGVHLSVLAHLVALAGTVLGLKEKE